jgi:hypothetical protein
MMKKKRTLIYYRNYFEDFYKALSEKVKAKIDWTFDLLEFIEVVPEQYLKHITGTDGIYEIRIQNRGKCVSDILFF